MKFEEALSRAMNEGAKIKLPVWRGYWTWDNEKETVMMHCTEDQLEEGQTSPLDIRETKRVAYTLANVARENWVIATEDNCELLGGTTKFTLADAEPYLNHGFSMTREAWVNEYVALRNGKIQRVNTETNEMKPWDSEEADFTTEDWMFYDETKKQEQKQEEVEVERVDGEVVE